MSRGALQLCAGLLLIPGLSAAASSPVELVLLVDTSHVKAGEVDVRATQKFCRDLLQNLPLRAHARAFRFGPGPDLVPCDPFRSECFQELPGESGTLSLQEALSKAEELLCEQPGVTPALPGRVLVLLGGSGDEMPALSNRCKIDVVALSASPRGLVLRDLPRGALGLYGALGQVRGFTVASFLKKKVWNPAVQQLLRQGEEEPDDNRVAWLGSALAFLSALLAAALWQFTTTRPAATPTSGSPLRSEVLPEPAALHPLYEASLQICGSTGRFPLSREQPMILGGKRGGGFSPAHIVIDDPLIAEEHCQILAEGETFFVIDLDSESGTFVNDEPVARRALTPGDRLRIGRTTFELLRQDR